MNEEIKNIIDATSMGKLEKEAVLKSILNLHNVIVPEGTFNCFGGNHAKGIKPCKEWCGEDMCQKTSN